MAKAMKHSLCRKRSRFLAALPLYLFLTSIRADASSITASVNYSAGYGSLQLQDSKSTSGTNQVGVGGTAGGFQGSAVVDASAYSSYGQAGIDVQVLLTTLVNNIRGDSFGGSAFATAQFTDLITIGKGGTFHFQAPVNVSAIHQVGSQSFSCSANFGSTGINCSPGNIAFVDLVLLSGQTLNVEAQMSANVSAGFVAGDNGVGFGTVEDRVDASHTLNLYISSPDGGTFTSASGATYSQAASVPEPSSLGCAGLGLFFLTYRLFRRKR